MAYALEIMEKQMTITGRKFIFRKFQSDEFWWYLACIVIPAFHLIFLFNGPRLGADSGLYSGSADALLLGSVNIVDVLLSGNENYLLSIALAYLAKILSSDNWAWIYIAMQSFFYVCMVLLVLRKIYVYLSPLSRFFFLALYFFAYDAWMWSSYVLSDSLYVSLTLFFVYLSLSLSFHYRRVVIAIFSLILAYLTRPVFYIVYAFFIFVIMEHAILRWAPENKSLHFRRAFHFIVFFLLSAFVLVVVYFIYRPSSSPLYFSDVFYFFNNIYSSGEVINDRPITASFPPSDYLEYLSLFLKRLFYFFVPFASDFSASHKILNSLFFFPVYFFSIYALIVLVSNPKLFRQGEYVLVISCIFLSIVTAVFHSLTVLDYDWRYRAPIMLPLLYSSLIGFDVVLSRKKNNFYLGAC